MKIFMRMYGKNVHGCSLVILKTVPSYLMFIHVDKFIRKVKLIRINLIFLYDIY